MDFIPGLMIIVRGMPYRAMAATVSEEATAIASDEMLLIRSGQMHRMVRVPLAMGRLSLDGADGAVEDGAIRTPTMLDADAFRKPLTSE